MSLVRLSGPPAGVVSLVELKAHLRIDHSYEDAVIAGYLLAAQNAIDGAGGWLGRALTTQQWRLTLDAFPACELIEIPLPPCQSVDQISYIDTDGVEQVLAGSPAAFQVYGIGGATPARVAPVYGTRWPATRRQGDAVSIDFTAGYGTGGQVPEAVRAAILLTATDLFEHRGSILSGDASERLQVTKAAESLLLPYRVWP